MEKYIVRKPRVVLKHDVVVDYGEIVDRESIPDSYLTDPRQKGAFELVVDDPDAEAEKAEAEKAKAEKAEAEKAKAKDIAPVKKHSKADTIKRSQANG